MSGLKNRYVTSVAMIRFFAAILLAFYCLSTASAQDMAKIYVVGAQAEPVQEAIARDSHREKMKNTEQAPLHVR